MLFIPGNFLEYQKWLKKNMLCIGIYDIQLPYTAQNFNELCVKESETWISSSLATYTFEKKELSTWILLNIKY